MSNDNVKPAPSNVEDAILTVKRIDGKMNVYFIRAYDASNSVTEEDLLAAITESDFNVKKVA